MKQYPVQERFQAFQGEGVHSGRSAFFIRLYGCPVRCPWCDSAGTWHRDFKPEDGVASLRMDVAELVAEAVEANPEFVVLTGGEPTIHDLEPLIHGMADAGLPVHLETCGAFFVPDGLAWVTVSPKENAPPVNRSMILADEVKIIVDSPEAIHKWGRFVSESDARSGVHVWLHPEWGMRDSPEVLHAINMAASHGVHTLPGRRFRAGWQLHKLYDVDSTDMRTKPKVPLGGDPDRGY